MRLIVWAIVAVGALLAGMSSLHADDAAPLAGSMWRPVPLSGYAGTDDQPVFLEFSSAGVVSGYAGCNRFTGSYRQNGDTLVFGPLATTRKACAPDVMEREAWLLKALKTVRRIAVTPSELSLKTLKKVVLLRLMPHG